MVSAGAGALRLTRALGLAVAAYGLSLAAHLVGGGSAPSPAGTGVLLFVTWWACVLVTHRRLGRVALVSVLALSQVLLHQAFLVAGTAGSCVTVVHAHAGHLVDGASTVCSAAGMNGMGPMSHQGPSGAAMVAAHVLAAVLLALVLARGEAAVWFLAGLVWPTPPAAAQLPAARRPLTVLPRLLLAVAEPVVPGSVGRRGPPWVHTPATS
ncbi:hypothetical protein [Phycicoccus sp. Root101]|uniref:hypothetical protein n=1 Tax=Phycicoccus sp. Root101 TaxID=1736421 RepID=UPI000703B9D8|nr:hypothetical protein [Phycicoccus sp. Root101]KQU70769.1 hypothetical protein ASC58_03050 [Phycicoccus sp. Root101]